MNASATLPNKASRANIPFSAVTHIQTERTIASAPTGQRYQQSNKTDGRTVILDQKKTWSRRSSANSHDVALPASAGRASAFDRECNSCCFCEGFVDASVSFCGTLCASQSSAQPYANSQNSTYLNISTPVSSSQSPAPAYNQS